MKYFKQYQQIVIEAGTEYLVRTYLKPNLKGYTYWFLKKPGASWNYHRELGPAFIEHDGGLFWYKNGQIHREDGPAIIYNDICKWALYDEICSVKEFLKIQKNKIVDIDGKLYLKDGRKIQGL